MLIAESHHRRAMTLIELMIVVAIIGLLAIVVLPLLANSSESRKTREAARSLSGFVSKAQMRAVGQTVWAGFMLVPPSGQSFVLDIFTADVPQIFQGDTIPAYVTGSVNSASGTFVLSSSIGGATVTGSAGDLVRFDGDGPWYALANSNSLTLRNGGTFAGTFVENVNQTIFNTPWPSQNVPHTYELMRQPIRSGSPLSFTDGRCVDLTSSGYVGVGGSFNVFSGSPITILFDGTGRLRQIVVAATRITPAGAVFLLVGRSDRVASPLPLTAGDDSTGANWQYSDSFWIGIDPLTGVVKAAECKPNALNAVDSQNYVRSELLATGR